MQQPIVRFQTKSGLGAHYSGHFLKHLRSGGFQPVITEGREGALFPYFFESWRCRGMNVLWGFSTMAQIDRYLGSGAVDSLMRDPEVECVQVLCQEEFVFRAPTQCAFVREKADLSRRLDIRELRMLLGEVSVPSPQYPAWLPPSFNLDPFAPRPGVLF